MPEYVTAKIAISSDDSDGDDCDEENSNEEISNEEDSDEEQNVFSFFFFDISNEKKVIILKAF